MRRPLRPVRAVPSEPNTTGPGGTRPPASTVIRDLGPQDSVVLAVCPEPRVWARYPKPATLGGSRHAADTPTGPASGGHGVSNPLITATADRGCIRNFAGKTSAKKRRSGRWAGGCRPGSRTPSSGRSSLPRPGSAPGRPALRRPRVWSGRRSRRRSRGVGVAGSGVSEVGMYGRPRPAMPTTGGSAPRPPEKQAGPSGAGHAVARMQVPMDRATLVTRLGRPSQYRHFASASQVDSESSHGRFSCEHHESR